MRRPALILGLLAALFLTPAIVAQSSDSDAEPEGPSCSGCGFGSTLEHGSTHFINAALAGTPTAGECAIDDIDESCYPSEPCSGGVTVNLAIYPGEVLIEEAGGACTPNSGTTIKNKSYTYNYSGDCGSYGTVNFRWYQNIPGVGCNGVGPEVDWARLTLYCNYCTKVDGDGTSDTDSTGDGTGEGG